MSASPGDHGEVSDDDPVARNRATHPRRTPDRLPLGTDVTRGVLVVTLAVIAAATLVLVVVLLGG